MIQTAPSQMDKIIGALLQEQQIPGLTLAVLRNRHVVETKGYGYANFEHNVLATPDTVFELASNEQEQEAFYQAEERVSLRLRAPVQTKIDLNKSELDQLQAKLDSLSLKMLEINLKIDDIERMAKPYKAQMDVIKDRYPDLVLPPDTYNEYGRLLSQWNGLNDQRNEFVAEVNDLIQQSNDAAEEFNGLTDRTNQLFDKLACLP